MSDFEYDYLGSLGKRNAILLCKSDYRRDYLRLLAKTYQCVIVGESIENEPNIKQDNESISDQNDAVNFVSKPPIDLLLVDLLSNMEINPQELSQIASYLDIHQIEAVIWTSLDDLDEVFGALPSLQCHFITDPNPLEAMPALTGLTGRDVMSHLSDISQDDSSEKEYAALHRISGELASLAKTLAEIAVIDDMTLSKTQKTAKSRYSDAEDFMNHSVFKDKPSSFTGFPTDDKNIFKNDIADQDAALNFGPASIGPASTRPTADQISPKHSKSPFVNNGDKYPSDNIAINADMVRAIIKQRRMRDNFFESALFADPAWDIMLDLMAARLSGQTVSVSSLCIAAAVPATTALRWITSMTKNGMLERKSDPMDARRVFMDLSDETYIKLEAYLIKVTQSGTPNI